MSVKEPIPKVHGAAGRGRTERCDVAVHECVKLPTLEAQIRQSDQGREEFVEYDR